MTGKVWLINRFKDGYLVGSVCAYRDYQMALKDCESLKEKNGYEYYMITALPYVDDINKE